MSMLLQTLPSRRQSRRRARIVRARILFVCIVMILSAYIAWSKPAVQTNTVTDTSAVPVPLTVEPEQSIDTEGALGGGRKAAEAAVYVAER